MTSDSRPRGLIDRAVAAYWDFSGSTRALLAERPSEATVLSFIMIGALISLCGDLAVQTVRRDGPWTDEELDLLSSQVVGRLLVFPLGVYLLSAIVGAIARLFRGRGDWYATRLAFAWAMIVGAPFTVMAQLLAAAAGAGIAGLSPGVAALALAAAPGLVGLYIWSACLAGAHEFSSPRRVMGVVIGLALALGAVSLGLGRLL